MAKCLKTLKISVGPSSVHKHNETLRTVINFDLNSIKDGKLQHETSKNYCLTDHLLLYFFANCSTHDATCCKPQNHQGMG